MTRARCLFACVGLLSCRDVQRFSTNGDHFEGDVIAGDFVRAGVGEGTRLCLTLDADHLQNAPGQIWSSDGMFFGSPLRPIPQIWHDPLSTLDFGQGRVKNMVYAATPNEAGDDRAILVFVSLMESGGVELRLVRGAPPRDGSAASDSIFAVFPLERKAGVCSF